jgi:hypothetical protein
VCIFLPYLWHEFLAYILGFFFVQHVPTVVEELPKKGRKEGRKVRKEGEEGR